GPAVFDDDILALKIARLGQTLAERANDRGRLVWRTTAKEPNYGYRLLRPSRERPRNRCAAEQRDELAASHSITSSASASNLSGIWRPSAVAVLRLITSLKIVGCWTGKSPGFSPLRMRPT